jgi:hypothetical protein
MQQVDLGTRKSHKGWRLLNTDKSALNFILTRAEKLKKHDYPTHLVSPSGEIYNISNVIFKDFCSKHLLSYSGARQALIVKKKPYQGWSRNE